MRFTLNVHPAYRHAVLLGVASALSACATHCGIFTYCDIPKNWPTSNTFIVETGNGDLCISGTRRHSCAARGMFQPGAQTVEILYVDDDDDDGASSELIAVLTVHGAPGDEFTADCFQYNGDKFLGLTAVLTGVEVRDATGRIVAQHPSHSVVRRNGVFLVARRCRVASLTLSSGCALAHRSQTNPASVIRRSARR